MHDEGFFPFFGIMVVFGGPIAALVLFRLLAHRERMELLRHGVVPPAGSAKDWARTMAGSAGSARQVPVDFGAESAQLTLRKGIKFTFIGMALFIGLSFIGFHEGPFGTTFRPGPWLLGGLIPMFIGISQIVIALLSGATLRPPGWTPAQAPPLYGVPPTPPPPPAEGTYDRYAYRPGATQELQRPSTPPERT